MFTIFIGATIECVSRSRQSKKQNTNQHCSAQCIKYEKLRKLQK